MMVLFTKEELAQIEVWDEEVTITEQIIQRCKMQPDTWLPSYVFTDFVEAEKDKIAIRHSLRNLFVAGILDRKETPLVYEYRLK